VSRVDRFITVVRGRWLAIVAVVAVAVGLAAGFTALQTPTYESTSTARLAPSAGDPTTGRDLDSIEYEDRLANTYRQILENRETRDWLAARLGVAAADAPAVTVALPANSQLIKVTAADPDAARAREAADLLTGRLADEIAASETVQVVEAARVSDTPTSPDWVLNLAVAGLAGLLAGIALAFALERRDRTLRDADAIEAVAGVPVLAEIPAGPGLDQTIVNSGSAQEEAFRGLPMLIAAGEGERPLRTILCTGLDEGPGTAAVVANLAVAFSRAGQSVVAVDADLRAPRLHGIFKVPNDDGLSEVLTADLDLDEAVKRSRYGVSVLTAGAVGWYEPASAATPRSQAVLESLTERFDIVIVNVHSILGSADVRILAPGASGVVMVVPRDAPREKLLRRATRDLTLLGARLMGLVLTDEGRAGSLSGRLRSAARRPAAR
jgi:capsular polysaccharide biosynthesis protein